MTRALLATLCVLACPAPLAAQTFAVGEDAPTHTGALTIGVDPALVTTLAYAQGIPRALDARALVIEGSLTLPVFLLPGLDAAKLGIAASMAFGRGLGVSLQVGTHVATSDDANAAFFVWGASVRARPGYFGEDGFLAADLGYRVALSSYLSHGAIVESAFGDRYPGADGGPRDGFYPFAAHRFDLGLCGGGDLSRSVSVYGAFGFVFTPQGEGILFDASYGLTPLYASLSLAVSF